MRIYSGECESGLCGGATDLRDSGGNPLFIGDIVIKAVHEASGSLAFYGLSVVVEDRPNLVGREEDLGPFVMGLRSVDINIDDYWYIERVKSFSDCINGEHWRDFGFSYRD